MIMMSRHKILFGSGLLCCLITQLMLISATESYYHPHDNIKNSQQHGRRDVDNVHEVLEDILQSKLSSYDNPYDEAYWYETLGYTYRLVYEQETSFLRQEFNIISTTDDRTSNELRTVESNIEQSIQAYLKAFSIYNGLLAEYHVEYKNAYEGEGNDIMYDIKIVRVYIAATLFNIGEVYSASIKSNHLAYDYYSQSSDLYIKLIEEYTTEMKENNVIDTLKLSMSDRIEIEISNAICSVRIGSILLQEETKLHNNQQILSDQLLNLDPSILGTNIMDLTNSMLNLDSTNNNIEDTISQILGKNPKDMEQMIRNEIKALLLLDGNEPQQYNNIDQKSFELLYPKSDKAYKYFQNALQIFQKYQMNDIDNTKMKPKLDDVNTNIDEIDDNRINDNNNNNNNVEEEARLKMSMRRLVSDSEFDVKRYMAICLQTIATIETLKNDLLKAAKHYEESLEIYYEILDSNNNNNKNDILDNDQSTLDNDTIIFDIRISVGEILLYLADIYLQQGKYENSKDRYQRTMEWLEEYEIPAQTIMQPKEKVTMDIDKTLTEYERLLNEYESMFGENSMDGGAGGGKVVLDDGGFFDDIHEDSYIAQPFKDEGYEGDLHASLGSLYMSKNDYIAASSHYMQALRLYELNGEQNERSMADVKFNLAALYLHLHDFTSSSSEYTEALDIYYQILGDNVNLMSPSLKLKETLEAFGIDESLFTDLKSSSLFGSLFGEENIDRADEAGSKVNQALQELMHQKQQHYEGDENNKGVGSQTDPKSQKIDDTLSKKTTFDTSSKKTRDIHESNKLYTQQNINLPDGTVVDLKNFLHQNNSMKEEL